MKPFRCISWITTILTILEDTEAIKACCWEMHNPGTLTHVSYGRIQMLFAPRPRINTRLMESDKPYHRYESGDAYFLRVLTKKATSSPFQTFECTGTDRWFQCPKLNPTIDRKLQTCPLKKDQYHITSSWTTAYSLSFRCFITFF